jgi:PAS domain S-box-containing protein
VSRSVVVDPSDEIRILHVDDDVNQSEFLQYFLPEMDEAFSIDSVCDPCQVFEKMESERYDCVVTDYQMPKINGIELAEKIKESFDLPIIIYTGQGSEEVAEAAFSAGIDDYLRKEMDPSHYQVLAKRIRQVVEKNRTELVYRTVVEQTRDALSIFIDGQMVFANQSTLDLLGVNNFFEIYGTNPFSVDNSRAFHQDFLEIGFQEYEISGKGGELFNVEVSTSPITYNGKDAILCFARDITEKKMLENEKKVSQKRFETLVNCSPDGITSVNPLGFVTFANKAFLELTGFSIEEIVGRHITNVGSIRKKDLIKHMNNFASILRGDVIPPIEFTWQTKEGNPGVGLAHVSMIEIEGRKEVLLISQDITNYRKKEKELDLMFEKAPYGIVQLDSSGGVLSINDAALRLSDLNLKEAHGKNINTVFNIEDGNVAALHSLLNRNVRNIKEPKPFELRIRSKYDDSVWVEAQTSLIEVDEENYGLQLILKDITNKKRLEEERKTYAQKLERFIQDMGKRFDSIIVSELDEELKINLDEIENRLTKLRYENIVKDSEIDEIEKAVSNIIKAIDDTAKKQLVTTAQFQEITADTDKY